MISGTASDPAPRRSADLEVLAQTGYLVLPNLLAADILHRLYDELEPHFEAAPFSRGSFYGEQTKRFGRILMRSATAWNLVLHARIMAVVEGVIGAGAQLNLSQAIEIHPGARVQPPHRDHDMWAIRKQPGETYMLNVMWALDAFAADNGATRIWPGSHDAAPGESLPGEDDAVAAVAPAGSAIIFLGQTLHSGGSNNTLKPRRGLIFSYCRDWLLPDENPWLAYPPPVAATFPPELATLVGYRERFAGLNNFEGQDPSILLDGSTPDIPGFVDAMSPDQSAIIAAYYDGLGNREPVG